MIDIGLKNPATVTGGNCRIDTLSCLPSKDPKKSSISFDYTPLFKFLLRVKNRNNSLLNELIFT